MKNYINLALVMVAATITQNIFAPPVSAHIVESYDIYLRRIINKTPGEIMWYRPVLPGRKMREVYTPIRMNGEVNLDQQIKSMPFTINVKNKLGNVRSIMFNLVPRDAGRSWFLKTTVSDARGKVLDRTSTRVSKDFVYNMNIVVEGVNFKRTRVTVMSHEQMKPQIKPARTKPVQTKPVSTLEMEVDNPFQEDQELIIEADETLPIGPPLSQRR